MSEPASEPPAEPPRKASPAQERRRNILRRVGQVVMLLALGFLAERLAGEFSELPKIELDARVAGAAALAIAACLGVFAAGAANWCVLLRRLDPETFLRMSVVFSYAQVAKYLPGNVFQYAFGVAVGSRLGVSKANMGVLLARDTLLSIAVASAIGGLGLWFGDQRAAVEPYLRADAPWLISGGLLFAILALAALGYFAKRKWFLGGTLAAAFTSLPVSAVLVVVCLNLLQFTLYGVCAGQVAAIFSPAGVQELPSLAALSSGFALAWVAGVLVLGAPGGLGVREAVLYALFQPALGQPLAVATFIGMRLALIVSELAFFAPAPLLLRRLQHDAGDAKTR